MIGFIKRHLWRRRRQRPDARPRAFLGPTVVFSGDGPYQPEQLRDVLPPGCICYRQQDLRPGVTANLVIVGRRKASRQAIAQLLRNAAATGAPPPRFLPQEGLIDELMYGRDWWGQRPDLLAAALVDHRGLQIAHELYVGVVPFPWPSVDTKEALDVGWSSSGGYAPETTLHALGYRITGLSRAQRWQILTVVAVPRLGLQSVVETIANHVRVRKAQQGGRNRYANAITEWEHDLQRLRSECWQPLRDRFPWPLVE